MTQETEEKPACQKETSMEIGKKEFRVFEIVSLGVQVILAGIGIGALCIYSGQLKVMRGTLTEMQRSGAQSTDQVWQAIGNLNWMARSSDWAQKQSQLATERSDRLAKLALDTSIQSSRADQRAWLGIYNDKTLISQSTKNDLPGIRQVNLWVHNSGKTPAMDIDGFVIVTTTQHDATPPDYDALMAEHGWTEKTRDPGYSTTSPGKPYLLGKNFATNDIWAPGAESSFEIDFTGIKDNTIDREARDGSTLWVYVLGAITYDDIYKRDATHRSERHKTTFCWVNYMPNQKSVPCPYGQTMN